MVEKGGKKTFISGMKKSINILHNTGGERFFTPNKERDIRYQIGVFLGAEKVFFVIFNYLCLWVSWV